MSAGGEMEPRASAGLLDHDAAEAGDLVFVGQITPHDPVTGELVTGSSRLPAGALPEGSGYGSVMLDVPVDRVRAQTATILNRLQAQLERLGLDFTNLVRLRLFLRDLRDLDAVERVLKGVIPDHPPLLTVVEVPPHGLDPELEVFADAVATRRSRAEWTIVGGREAADPQAIRVGEFVFVNGVTGLGAASRRPVRSTADLGAELPATFVRTGRLEREEAILAQSWVIFRQVRDLLGEVDGSLRDVVKVNGWLTFEMRDYRPLAEVREFLAEAEGMLPASAGVRVSRVVPAEAELSYDVIARLPGEVSDSRTISGARSAISPMYADLVEAGPYVFTAGDVPVDATVPRPVVRLRELDGDGRALAFGRPYPLSRVEIQSWYVYTKQAERLREVGAGLRDTLHQVVYMRDPAQYPAVERVASLFFEGAIPPTTIVPVEDVSPFKEVELEIELVTRAGATPPERELVG